MSPMPTAGAVLVAEAVLATAATGAMLATGADKDTFTLAITSGSVSKGVPEAGRNENLRSASSKSVRSNVT